MPTTSNFGWTTPADTDLVKDGAAAIRTLGNGIDTSLVDLKGGTTGQVLSKASNTDLDFSWVAQDDSNAIQNALLTTTGDTIYASAASTPARLGIGTTGQVLTVSGGIPSWATPTSGGMTLISTTTLSGSSVSITSIPNTYYNLQLVIRDFLPSVDGQNIRVGVNSDSGANRYRMETGNPNSNSPFNETAWNMSGQVNDNAVANGLQILDIYDYANTATWKIVNYTGVLVNDTTTTNANFSRALGVYNQTGAISSIQILVSSGTMGGTALLYGVK